MHRERDERASTGFNIWCWGATLKSERSAKWLSGRTSWVTAMAVLFALGWSVVPPPAAALPSVQPAEFRADVPAPSLGLSEEAFTDGGVRVAARTDPSFGVYSCLEEPTEPSEGWPYDFAVEVRSSEGDVLVSADLPGVADVPECAAAQWTPGTGVLQPGATYEVFARAVHADGQAYGPWSEALSLLVAPAPDVPTPSGPAADGYVTDANVMLSAHLESSVLPSRGVFRVENQWGNLVAEGVGSAASEAGGITTFTFPAPASGGAFEYRWQVLAWDGVSQSDWTELRTLLVVAPPTAPIARAAFSARRGAEVHWYAAHSADPYPVLDYTVTASPGGHSVTVPGDANSALLDQLPAGEYSITVTARNDAAVSQPSRPIAAAVAPAVADLPQNVDVALLPGETTVELTWDPPLDPGDAPIDHYSVMASPYYAPFAPVTTTLPTATIEDLTFGEDYRALIHAHSALGASDPASVEFRPITTPGPPSGLQARLGDGELTVSWEEPTDHGGSWPTGYVLTAHPGGATLLVEGQTSATFPGLQNGTSYTFTVAARNAAGVGEASEPSPPRAPTSKDTDTDADGLNDILEEQIGSNIELQDSDFDGLGDAYEVLHLIGHTSPTSIDTDGDGIDDGATDTDADGLTNAEEATAGTEPSDDDTDVDGLFDGEESGYQTSALLEDTDGDGIEDGREVRLGLNPAAADSDDDGVLDGDVALVATLESDADVSVAATGTASGLENLTVATDPVSPFSSAISPAVTVTSGVGDEESPVATDGGTLAARSAMSTASLAGSSSVVLDVINLPVPVAYADVSALAAFRKNPGSSTWEQAENQIDLAPGGGTVVVHAPELGVTYTVVDLDDWRTRTQTCEFSSAGSVLLDVDMVLDETPSVQRADPTGQRFDAALAMLSNLRAGDDIAVHNLELAENFIDFGWGGYWQLDGLRHQNAAHLGVPAYGRPIDRARTAIEALSTYERPLLQSAPDVDPDDEVAGLAYWGFGTPLRTGESNPFDGANLGTPLGSCRNRTVVLITDGELEASDTPTGDDDILSILDPQQPPTHILDVGAGGDGADWLRAVAQRTGGTYTHIPTDTDVPDWGRDLQQPRPSVDPSDATTDTDSDGVPDWVEFNGVRSSTPPAAGSGVDRRIFYSDWNDPDTDGDGITDGDELGTPLPRAAGSRYPQVTYDVVSDPHNPDSDNDGLDDPDESELLSWPLHQDRDGDGLLDGDEMQWGTFPNLPDSDMDGWTDSEEADPSNYGRLDPVNYNEKKSRTWWLHDAHLGFACGDTEVCRRDSVPWLVGNVTSGALVFGDVRDMAWAVNDENYAWAGFIGLTLIPGPGDAAGVAAKFARIMPRLSKAERTAASYKLWARASENVPEAIELLRHVDLDLYDNLKLYGLADARIAELVAFNSIDHLKRIFDSPQLLRQSPFGASRPPLVFVDHGKSAERWLRNQLGLPTDWKTTCLFILWGCRYPDGLQSSLTGGSGLIMHESKEGLVTYRALKQIARDAALVARQENGIDGVVWHFFMSGTTGMIGPSQGVLEALSRHNIPYYIHITA
ncbi:fibronectin type III domain-containing protein [Cellulomonas sp. S1-8]|uniref:fibronectin type III domain-containing protein n=1 Tax=Cellulomonas sp. S1-8 TaxID=2904790 RepID=UPI002244EB34|nr:fibronectin type III domain-containing protein [Cellulomonas sp. S1-8]UZN02438.1 fibronectin type III domain-containing protein [Cellulomonas sp. S1-8]